MLKAIKRHVILLLKKQEAYIICRLYVRYYVEFNMESTYAQKKGKCHKMDGQRSGTLRTSCPYITLKWIALLFGTEFKSSSVDSKRVL